MNDSKRIGRCLARVALLGLVRGGTAAAGSATVDICLRWLRSR